MKLVMIGMVGVALAGSAVVWASYRRGHRRREPVANC